MVEMLVASAVGAVALFVSAGLAAASLRLAATGAQVPLEVPLERLREELRECRRVVVPSPGTNSKDVVVFHSLAGEWVAYCCASGKLVRHVYAPGEADRREELGLCRRLVIRASVGRPLCLRLGALGARGPRVTSVIPLAEAVAWGAP